MPNIGWVEGVSIVFIWAIPVLLALWIIRVVSRIANTQRQIVERLGRIEGAITTDTRRTTNGG